MADDDNTALGTGAKGDLDHPELTQQEWDAIFEDDEIAAEPDPEPEDLEDDQ